MKKNASWQDELEAEEEEFKPLTAQEAQAWRQRNPQVSAWRLVGGQVLMGIVVALTAWLVSGQARVGWSAAYGALCVVVPAAVFAFGFMRAKATGLAGAAMLSLFVWEFAKLVLCIAMLAAAPRLVDDLSWLALLAGVVAVMKTYWIALLVQFRV